VRGKSSLYPRRHTFAGRGFDLRKNEGVLPGLESGSEKLADGTHRPKESREKGEERRKAKWNFVYLAGGVKKIEEGQFGPWSGEGQSTLRQGVRSIPGETEGAGKKFKFRLREVQGKRSRWFLASRL